jgi:hypothetical protein
VSLSNVSATLDGCALANNSVALYGGGVFMDEGTAALHLSSTLFENNVALVGSQMHSLAGGSVNFGRNATISLTGSVTCAVKYLVS